MKRHPFRTTLLALALLGALTACQPTQPPSSGPITPRMIHRAPGNEAINLTPTRDGSVAAAWGDGSDAGMDNQPPAQIANGPTIRVGLLLPLTGRHSALGKALQDAATVSLFDKYARLSVAQAATRVELLPKDTGDTPEQARAAMQAALDDGAALIIGPVFSPATDAAAPLAKEKGINVISLTNNPAQATPGVYAFGFSPQEQTARVVSYALTNGKPRIAALVPDSPSGEIVLKAARDTLSAAGFVLAAEAKYSPQGVGIESALTKLIPPDTAPAFDALLLPEGGPALNTILRALGTRGVTSDNVQLIGTGFWDDPGLLRRTSLDGAWLASSPPQFTAQYEQRFLATYGYVPTRISSLAYDAVALAVTLATSGRDFSTSSLTQSGGYSGPANGIFRLRHDGLVERGLAVLRVDGTNLVVIDPAPAGFTTPAAAQ